MNERNTAIVRYSYRCEVTLWAVRCSYFQRRNVSEQANIFAGTEPRRPLIARVLVQPEPVVLVQRARRLRKYVTK